MDNSNSSLPLFILGATLLILFIFMLLINFNQISVENPVAVNDTLLGAILTAITAYILYNQTLIQKRQTNIERKSLEYETEPSIQVVSSNYKKDDVKVELANYGRGVAVNLKLVVELQCPGADWYISEPNEITLKRLENGNATKDDSIRPNTEPETYIAKSVNFAREVNGETEEFAKSAPETLVRELKNNGDGPITISIEVIGESLKLDDTWREDVDKIETLLSDLPSTPRLSDIEKKQSH